MNQNQFNAVYIILLFLILVFAGYSAYRHVEYIDIMRHSPCDLCIKCPANIVSSLNLTSPIELWGINGTNLHT